MLYIFSLEELSRVVLIARVQTVVLTRLVFFRTILKGTYMCVFCHLHFPWSGTCQCKVMISCWPSIVELWDFFSFPSKGLSNRFSMGLYSYGVLLHYLFHSTTSKDVNERPTLKKQKQKPNTTVRVRSRKLVSVTNFL